MTILLGGYKVSAIWGETGRILPSVINTTGAKPEGFELSKVAMQVEFRTGKEWRIGRKPSKRSRKP